MMLGCLMISSQFTGTQSASQLAQPHWRPGSTGYPNSSASASYCVWQGSEGMTIAFGSVFTLVTKTTLSCQLTRLVVGLVGHRGRAALAHELEEADHVLRRLDGLEQRALVAGGEGRARGVEGEVDVQRREGDGLAVDDVVLVVNPGQELVLVGRAVEVAAGELTTCA